MFQEFAGQGREDEGFSGERQSNRVEKVGWCNSFEEEPGCSRTERLIDVFVELEGGQNDDARWRFKASDQFLGGVETVAVGHPNVHEYDIWVESGYDFDDLVAVCCFSDDTKIGLVVDDGSQPDSDHRVVVGEYHPYGH